MPIQKVLGKALRLPKGYKKGPVVGGRQKWIRPDGKRVDAVRSASKKKIGISKTQRSNEIKGIQADQRAIRNLKEISDLESQLRRLRRRRDGAITQKGKQRFSSQIDRMKAEIKDLKRVKRNNAISRNALFPEIGVNIGKLPRL